jgi:hypothetical protein
MCTTNQNSQSAAGAPRSSLSNLGSPDSLNSLNIDSNLAQLFNEKPLIVPQKPQLNNNPLLNELIYPEQHNHPQQEEFIRLAAARG